MLSGALTWVQVNLGPGVAAYVAVSSLPLLFPAVDLFLTLLRRGTRKNWLERGTLFICAAGVFMLCASRTRAGTWLKSDMLLRIDCVAIALNSALAGIALSHVKVPSLTDIDPAVIRKVAVGLFIVCQLRALVEAWVYP